jgi:hypothetical protein
MPTIEEMLTEILGTLRLMETVVTSSHKRISDVDIKLRNTCDKCYYLNTHHLNDKPHTVVGESLTIPTPRTHEIVPSPETDNKFIEDCKSCGGCGTVEVETNGIEEKIYSRPNKKKAKKEVNQCRDS